MSDLSSNPPSLQTVEEALRKDLELGNAIIVTARPILRQLLAEPGLATADLARRLANWMQGGRDIAFIIGGADGLDRDVKKDADMLLSLSAMTLPHAMVRVLLAEQLYRAMSMNLNHPYHRE